MDVDAFYKITQGLYILGSKHDGRWVGSIVDAVMQVANNPFILAVSCHNNSFTKQCIEKLGCFSLSALPIDISPEIIKIFGFQSSQAVNKWSFVDHNVCEGMPYMKDNIAIFICEVVQSIVFESNTLFLGKVTHAQNNQNKEPITYQYYRNYLKNELISKLTKSEEVNMSENKDKHWICKVCGYVYDGDIPFEELPETWVCPICGLDKSYFVFE